MSDKLLYSKVLGEGDKHLIIMHGLFGLLDNWGTLGKKWAEHFTVHLLDARNHGRSFHSPAMSHQLMAEDVYYYMQSKNLEKAAVLGHSLGGKAMMYFALEHPDMVTDLIVADIAPKAYAPHHLEIIRALKNLDYSKIERRGDADEQLKGLIKDVGVRQFLLKSLYHKKEGGYALRFNLDALSENYEDLIGQSLPQKQFQGKTIFIGGANSNYIEKQDDVVIHHYFPKAEITHIQGAGHWLHAEKPNEFLEMVMNFLNP